MVTTHIFQLKPLNAVCNEHGIEMICLPSNSSHHMQPLDTHFNKTLQNLWAKAVTEFLKESDLFTFSKDMQNKRGLVLLWTLFPTMIVSIE